MKITGAYNNREEAFRDERDPPSEVRTIFLALNASSDLISYPLSAFDVLPAVYRLILSMEYQNQVRFVSVVYRFRF